MLLSENVLGLVKYTLKYSGVIGHHLNNLHKFKKKLEMRKKQIGKILTPENLDKTIQMIFKKKYGAGNRTGVKVISLQ